VSDPADGSSRSSLRLPADQRRQQLFEVARERFAQQGFHATSMDEIAEAAGVTKPVLYQHFPSKRALYVELLEETGRQLLSTLADATARAGSLRERVELGFHAYFRFAVGNRSAFLFLLGTSLRSDPEFARIVEEILDAAAETIATLIEIPAPDAQRQMLANAIVGMAESVGLRVLREPGAVVDSDQLAQWISELAWFGLRGVRTD
jgi:AcrR family transcriptional regulator